MPEPSLQILDIKNDLTEVERANNALREMWVRCALPEDFEVPVTMCLEEVLSNVIRHGCSPGQDCGIRVRYSILGGVPGGIEIEVSDGANAFDPLALPPPDLTVPLEQRKAGGLGVFLVRQMMDEVHYENGGTEIHMMKH